MVHHHSHSHAHPGQGHAHHPVPKTYTRTFQIGIALNIGFVLIEAAFGWISQSLALLGVAKVHDLHIWAMSTTETALTAHLVMPAGSPGDGFLAQVSDDLHHHFEIDHTTLQIETGDDQYPCRLEPDHQV